MAEIQEVMEDATKKIKKKFKEKPVFFTALIIVVIYALYKLFTADDTDEEVVTNAYVPIGYDGYPEISDGMLEDYDNFISGGFGDLGGGTGGTIGGTGNSGVTGDASSDLQYTPEAGFTDDRYDDLLDRLDDLKEENAMLQEQLMMSEETLLNSWDETAFYTADGDLLFSQKYAYKVLTGDSPEAQLQQQLEQASNLEFRNAVIAKMKANSAAWNSATTQAEKDALHEENVRLAGYVGGTYDSTSGTWKNPDNSSLYGSKTTNYGNDVTSSTVAKMQANSEAWAKASTAAEKQRLYEENQKLGKSIGATYDSGSGKWYTSSGSELLDYTKKKTTTNTTSTGSSSSSSSSGSSTKSSSSSSSSSSKPKQGTVTGRVTWTKTKNSDGSTTHTAKDSNGNVKASYTTK